MIYIKVFFWVLLFVVFYSYIGYGMLIFLIVKIRKIINRNNKQIIVENYEPNVTLFVAAYNEKDYVHQKVKNSFSLNYPKEKVKHLWITDGSTDGTPDLLKEYEGIEVFHEHARGGKIGAINRGMKFVDTSIVIFSDGNTILGKESIQEIVNCFKNPKVGCVSGEKRIISKDKDSAAGSGEGIYWKYESFLKNYDSELYSAVGAAGELFAIRTELFEEVENNILLDDFIISLRIAMQGYVIKYAPNAYAEETSSANVKEELKRKIRISAGAIQSIVKLKNLLNPFKFGILSFQYISHKVLRWLIVPFALIIILVINFFICQQYGSFLEVNIYSGIFWLQTLIYTLAFFGYILENLKIRFKLLFIPYYIVIMNISVFLGLIRYIKGNQSVNWERAKRAK